MPPESAQSRWFTEHVLPHEPMLRAWLQSRFSSGVEIDDVVQEAFLRVIRAHERGQLDSPKAFLFATARRSCSPSLSSSALGSRRLKGTEFGDDGVGVRLKLLCSP